MSEPQKTTLDYSRLARPEFSRFALICIGLAGVLATMINACAAIGVAAIFHFIFFADDLGWFLAMLEVLGFAFLGYKLTRPKRGPAVRAFGYGIVGLTLLSVASAAVALLIRFLQ